MIDWLIELGLDYFSTFPVNILDCLTVKTSKETLWEDYVTLLHY